MSKLNDFTFRPENNGLSAQFKSGKLQRKNFSPPSIVMFEDYEPLASRLARLQFERQQQEQAEFGIVKAFKRRKKRGGFSYVKSSVRKNTKKFAKKGGKLLRATTKKGGKAFKAASRTIKKNPKLATVIGVGSLAGGIGSYALGRKRRKKSY